MYITSPRGGNHGGFGALPVVATAGEAIGLGITVFSSVSGVMAQTGGFRSQSATVSALHPNTPASQTFRRCELDFRLDARKPNIATQVLQQQGRTPAEINAMSGEKFWFRLSFEYNGNDLRGVTVQPLFARSDSLRKSVFETIWTSADANDTRNPVAEVRLLLQGRWEVYDPTPFTTNDTVSFGGRLTVNARGLAKLEMSFSERDWVSVGVPPSAIPPCLPVMPWLPPPPRREIRMPIVNVVTFAVNSDRIVETDERRLMTWLNNLSPAIKAGIASGTSPIQAEGFASTTQGGPANVVLSRRRAARVAQLIRDALGSNTAVNVLARGEYQARTPDRVESPAERRVVITINHLVAPATPGGVQGFGGFAGRTGIPCRRGGW